MENNNEYCVKDLENRDDFVFVSDSQEVKEIKEYLYNDESLKYIDSFFVRIEDGDYTDIYAMEGLIPRLNRTLWKVL